jgi:gamma-glutamylcyclotransferase (GGCT)/AIG2-like uncharacterized protein YtfP
MFEESNTLEEGYHSVMTHYYFAYGSNISSKRLLERCPSAQFITVAYMPEFKLCFPQHRNDGVLVAGLSNSLSDKLWGAVYSIAESDIATLDMAEDYKDDRELSLNSYLKIKDIKIYDKFDQPIALSVFVYKQNKEESRPAINGRHEQEYLNHIITGYREYGLDQLSPEIFKVMETLI